MILKENGKYESQNKAEELPNETNEQVTDNSDEMEILVIK